MRPALFIFAALLIVGFSASSPRAEEPSKEAIERLTKHFETAHVTNDCKLLENTGDWAKSEFYALEIKRAYSAEKDKVTLGRFVCLIGAYNVTSMFLLIDAYDEIVTLTPARPVTKEVYEDPKRQTKLKSVRVTGMIAYPGVVDAEFDPETRELKSHAKWRGLGDAASTGTWLLEGSRFVLKRYDIDPTYDGKIDPVTVVDYTKEAE